MATSSAQSVLQRERHKIKSGKIQQNLTCMAAFLLLLIRRFVGVNSVAMILKVSVLKNCRL